MAWASGTFSRVHDWTTDEANAINPSSSRFDAEDDNFATGINSCLHKGGQNSPTADINWGGQKITNLGTPTSNADAATKAYVDTLAGGWTTGDFRFTTRTSAASGWVLLSSGGSIGSGSSGATNRANDDTENLWKHLYDTFSDSVCAVSGGRTTRDADWTANKTLGLPDWRGRAPGVAGSGSGLTARSQGDVTGAETSTALIAHTHTVSGTTSSDGAHTHDIDSAATNSDTSGGGKANVTPDTGGTLTTASGGAHSHTVTGTAASAGSGSSFSIMSPEFFINAELKL